MLFTDADIPTIDSLRAIDSEVEKVARAEEIVLVGDGSIARKTMDECAYWITAEMQSSGGFSGGIGINANHLAAIYNGTVSFSAPYVRISNVVATSIYDRTQSPLERWVNYRALVNLFRAAQNRKVNDRYEFKMKQYTDEVKHAEGVMKSMGLPLVDSAFPCPGAIREPNAGRWSNGNASIVADVAGTATGNWFVAVTWVDSSQYVDQTNKNNSESGPSAQIEAALDTGFLLKVDITSLNPPTGAMPLRGLSEGSTSYLNATGWNVYVGSDPEYLYLQNATPIAIATKTYTLTGNPVENGYTLQPGQYPTSSFPFVSGGGRIMRA